MPDLEKDNMDGVQLRSGYVAGTLKCVSTTLIFWLSISVWLVLGPMTAVSQEHDAYEAADTSSPRDTLQSFIEACNEINNVVHGANYFDRSDSEHLSIAERAIDCINDSELPGFARLERAGEVAVCLKEILDRVELPPWEEIPGMEEIKAAGGFEKLTNYRIPNTRITIARVEAGARKHEYLFSTGTVDRAIEYFKQIEAKPYRTAGPTVSPDLYKWFISAPGHPAIAAIVDNLPKTMRLGRTWGMANWKWPGVILSTVVALGLMILVYGAQARYTSQAVEKSLFRYWLTILFPIVAMLIPFAAKYVGYRYLTLRSWPLYISDFTTIFVALLASLAVVFALSNRIAASVIASPHINPAGLNAQLIRIVSKLASLVASVVLFLVGGQYLGIPIATLLTSAGIGGIAVALGAQDTLRTLFGTINLLSDKPFRVGDRIVVESYDGVVEDLGLRSTRLRLLTGHQVTVPNDRLAGNDIENVTRRKSLRRVSEIHIPLDTSLEKVERAVAIVREALEDHEGMDPVLPPRIFFDEFNATAFTIKFFYWFTPPNYWEFKAFGEKVNFTIFRKFDAEGIQFSLPLRYALWQDQDAQGPLDVNLIDHDGRRGSGE